MAPKAAINQKDKFGTIRYNAVKEAAKLTPLNKERRSRFSAAEAVFLHRREIHHQLHNAQLDEGWANRRNIYDLEQRLACFKSAEFFVGAMEAIIEEQRNEDEGALAAKIAAKAARQVQPVNRGWGPRY